MAVFHPSQKVVTDRVKARLSAGLWVLPVSPVAEIGLVEMARRMPPID